VLGGAASIDEPSTYIEALASSEGLLWKEAMKRELDSLEENKVWELTELPEGRIAVGCKWVFKKKRNEKGEVIKFKARLVAKGYSQKSRIDYE